MTDKELNITLREMARLNGLCDMWFFLWSDDATIDECLDMYVKGFDFAVRHDWPKPDFIRANFRMDDLHRHNIYIDEEVRVDASNGYYIFLGSCTGTLVADGPMMATVYLRHTSRINIDATGGAHVHVTYYEDSDGELRADKWSRIHYYLKNNKQILPL